MSSSLLKNVEQAVHLLSFPVENTGGPPVLRLFQQAARPCGPWSPPWSHRVNKMVAWRDQSEVYERHYSQACSTLSQAYFPARFLARLRQCPHDQGQGRLGDLADCVLGRHRRSPPWWTNLQSVLGRVIEHTMRVAVSVIF